MYHVIHTIHILPPLRLNEIWNRIKIRKNMVMIDNLDSDSVYGRIRNLSDNEPSKLVKKVIEKDDLILKESTMNSRNKNGSSIKNYGFSNPIGESKKETKNRGGYRWRQF
jgi:hypothetical protein